MVSSLSPHSLQLLFCCVLSFLALILFLLWLVEVVSTLLLWEFFKPMLIDGLPMDSEWQQVSLNLQDTSKYSVRYQQCCRLKGLHSSSNSEVLESQYRSFGDCAERTSYNWYHSHLHSMRGQGTYLSFLFLSVLLSGQPRRQNPLLGRFSLFGWLFLGLLVWPRLSYPSVSQNPRLLLLLLLLLLTLINDDICFWYHNSK